ncbi:hypothetical protein WEH80_01205 [Actinomycetes bacterium KLBMP 9759]
MTALAGELAAAGYAGVASATRGAVVAGGPARSVDLRDRILERLAAGDRDGAVELFLVDGAATPPQAVASARCCTTSPVVSQEGGAPTAPSGSPRRRSRSVRHPRRARPRTY